MSGTGTDELEFDEPQDNGKYILWGVLGFVAGFVIVACLGGVQGVKVYLAVVVIVAYVATVAAARGFFTGAMRLLAGLILVLLWWLMVITTLPMQLAVWAKPTAQWLSDDTGTNGVWANMAALVVVGILALGGLVWAGFLYMSESGLKIILSSLLAFPVVFLVLGMVMQENR